MRTLAPTPLGIRPGQATGIGRRVTGWWTCLLLAVYASKATWYDLRIPFESLRGDSFRVILALYASLLLPFIAFGFLRGATLFLRQSTLLCFAVLCLYGATINLVRGVEVPVFVVQDLCKLAFIPTAFLLVFIDRPASCDQMLRRLADVVLVYLLAKILIMLLYYHGSFGLYYGGVVDLYPFCYYGAKYCETGRGKPLLAGQLALLALTVAALGQKRTVLVAAAVVACYLLATRWKRLLNRPTTYIVASVALVSAAPLLGSGCRDRFTQVPPCGPAARSDNLRRGYVPHGRGPYRDGDPAGTRGSGLVLRHGARAAAFENDAVDPHGDGLTHSVHFTPAAMLLRYGLAGVVFYLALAWAAIMPRAKASSRWMTQGDITVMRCYGVVAGVGLAGYLRSGRRHDYRCYARRPRSRQGSGQAEGPEAAASGPIPRSGQRSDRSRRCLPCRHRRSGNRTERSRSRTRIAAGMNP